MPVSYLDAPSLTQLLGYVDGGVGSVLFQAAIGGLLTCAYFVGAKWSTLKQAVLRRFQTKSE